MRKVSIIFAALLLSSCASVARLDAAGDVHEFLLAVRDDDRAKFEAHVDRPALKASLESRLVSEGRKRGGDSWGALAAVLAGPAADLAGEALIQPRTFRTAAEYYGYTPDKPIPGRLAIAGALKALDDGRVCVVRKKNGPCQFTFTHEGETWRLTSFDGDATRGR